MNDPVPGAEDVRPSWAERLRARLPKMPEIDKKKAGKTAQTAGVFLLCGAAGCIGAIAFLVRPVTTLIVAGTLVAGGKVLEKSGQIEEATEEVGAAAAAATS